MNVKRRCVIFLLCIVSYATVASHDGMVNITGTIQNMTCDVSPDSQNKTVDMGTMAQEQFRKAGDSSLPKVFTINLENCGPAASEAVVTFTGTSDEMNHDYYAIESGQDSATGLALGIYDSEGTVLPSGTKSSGFALTPGQESVSLTFMAKYIAVSGNITAGSADSLVTFQISYN